MNLGDRYGTTPLHLAAAACAPAVAMLLDYGAEVDAVQAQGMTPLMVAAQNRQQPTIRLLLTHGADPSRIDHQGKRYLDWMEVPAGALH